jgi:hypothetical protein
MPEPKPEGRGAAEANERGLEGVVASELTGRGAAS